MTVFDGWLAEFDDFNGWTVDYTDRIVPDELWPAAAEGSSENSTVRLSTGPRKQNLPHLDPRHSTPKSPSQ